MVIQTTKEVGGVVYDYAYSDAGMMIERNGSIYSEALDPFGSGRAYTETDKPIEEHTDEVTETDYQSALYEFGAKLLPKLN